MNKMNFFIGFVIVFGGGLALVLGLSLFLENNGYSQNEIMVAKLILSIVVIAIPPLLLFFGGSNHEGENKLEELGKPVSFLGSLVGSGLSNPTTLIIVLLIVIVNFLVWK